jgi:putative membrane protein
MPSDFEPEPEFPPGLPERLPESPSSTVPASAVPASALEDIFRGHLHPLTIVFAFLRAARGLIPLATVALVGGRGYGWIVIVFASLSTIATSLIRYFSFSYRIEKGELIIESGLVERRHRSIPLERVQEIRIEQGIVHRLFDVVDATIETGGGDGVEAKLSVLSRAEADRLRGAVRAGALRSAPVDRPGAAEPEDRVLRRLSWKDLALAGITTNHLLSALALAGAAWNFADDLLPDTIYKTAANYLARNADRVWVYGTKYAFLAALGGLLAIFVIGSFFSVIGSIVLFYGFTISSRGDDLRRRYGLLTRRASSLPRRRIQVLEIEEKFFRRLFGLATLRADTAGAKRDNEDDNKGRDVLLPIIRTRDVASLLPDLLPDFHEEQTEWRKVSPLAIRRGIVPWIVLCLLASLGLFFFRHKLHAIWPLQLLPFVCLPFIWWMNVASYRRLGYALSGRYFQTRRGWLGRSTHIVPLSKVQAVRLQQSPLDRRLGLASLRVDTAGQAYTEGGPRIENLPIEEARSLSRTLAQMAARMKYRY